MKLASDARDELQQDMKAQKTALQGSFARPAWSRMNVGDRSELKRCCHRMLTCSQLQDCALKQQMLPNNGITMAATHLVFF